MRSDSELIKAYLGGQEEAFEELVNRHIKALYAFVYRSVKNEALASDIVQEVFLKVWQSLKRFDTGQHFLPWLFTIARRTTIDWLRKRSHVSFSELNAPDEDGHDYFEANIPDMEPLPDEIFDRITLTQELEQALDALPVEQKMIMLLHLNDDMTFEEIANVMEKPMNTVKSAYRRGLIKLRALLTNAPKSTDTPYI
jgi:RNA polymerase sigma-70 factor (ECF subfamily)